MHHDEGGKHDGNGVCANKLTIDERRKIIEEEASRKDVEILAHNYITLTMHAYLKGNVDHYMIVSAKRG